MFQAPTRDGIYVVDKVTPELDEFILVASYISPNKSDLITPISVLYRISAGKDGDSNERRWSAGNQPTDTSSIDKRRDEERGDRSRRARKRR